MQDITIIKLQYELVTALLQGTLQAELDNAITNKRNKPSQMDKFLCAEKRLYVLANDIRKLENRG